MLYEIRNKYHTRSLPKLQLVNYALLSNEELGYLLKGNFPHAVESFSKSFIIHITLTQRFL